jgi:hypothetical protein
MIIPSTLYSIDGAAVGGAGTRLRVRLGRLDRELLAAGAGADGNGT